MYGQFILKEKLNWKDFRIQFQYILCLAILTLQQKRVPIQKWKSSVFSAKKNKLEAPKKPYGPIKVFCYLAI